MEPGDFSRSKHKLHVATAFPTPLVVLNRLRQIPIDDFKRQV